MLLRQPTMNPNNAERREANRFLWDNQVDSLFWAGFNCDARAEPLRSHASGPGRHLVWKQCQKIFTLNIIKLSDVIS